MLFSRTHGVTIAANRVATLPPFRFLLQRNGTPEWIDDHDETHCHHDIGVARSAARISIEDRRARASVLARTGNQLSANPFEHHGSESTHLASCVIEQCFTPFPLIVVCARHLGLSCSARLNTDCSTNPCQYRLGKAWSDFSAIRSTESQNTRK